MKLCASSGLVGSIPMRFRHIQLGRRAEAEEAQARYFAASSGRSNLRIDSVKP
jgi:hypothetical protein